MIALDRLTEGELAALVDRERSRVLYLERQIHRARGAQRDRLRELLSTAWARLEESEYALEAAR